jgi:hypothetical protein
VREVTGKEKPGPNVRAPIALDASRSNRGALHDLAFNREHRAATGNLFLPFAQPVDATKVRRDARQHTRNRRDTLSRASPSMNNCRPLVTLLRPFGARETIWLASFLLLTARTINRLFLVTLRVVRRAYAPTSLALLGRHFGQRPFS